MAFEQMLVLTRDGRQLGPMDFAALGGWVQSGQVPPDATAVCVATGGRRAVGEVLGLPPPGYPPPGYPPPGYPPPPPQGFQPIDLIVPNLNNGLAVAAGYLGLFSLICMGPVLGIPAVICGILALRRPARGGKFRAWFGIVTGGLITLATIVLLVVLALAPKK